MKRPKKVYKTFRNVRPEFETLTCLTEEEKIYTSFIYILTKKGTKMMANGTISQAKGIGLLGMSEERMHATIKDMQNKLVDLGMIEVFPGKFRINKSFVYEGINFITTKPIIEEPEEIGPSFNALF